MRAKLLGLGHIEKPICRLSCASPRRTHSAASRHFACLSISNCRNSGLAHRARCRSRARSRWRFCTVAGHCGRGGMREGMRTVLAHCDTDGTNPQIQASLEKKSTYMWTTFFPWPLVKTGNQHIVTGSSAECRRWMTGYCTAAAHCASVPFTTKLKLAIQILFSSAVWKGK